jgi:hypothetical protein
MGTLHGNDRAVGAALAVLAAAADGNWLHTDLRMWKKKKKKNKVQD